MEIDTNATKLDMARKIWEALGKSDRALLKLYWSMRHTKVTNPHIKLPELEREIRDFLADRRVDFRRYLNYTIEELNGGE